MVDFIAVQRLVSQTLDGLETTDDIELGQGKPVDAAGPHGLAHQHRVKPAAAPFASGVDAKFLAAAADLLANGVMQLGRKRPLAASRSVRLADAEHVADRAWAHASARSRLRRHGVG